MELLSFLSVIGKIWPIVIAVLYFGFLIVTHELGHFSAARLFGVRVNEFSIGMGPRLLKKPGKRGTLYSLKAVPFGGSVLLEGEDSESEDAQAFGKQRPWKRFVILAAGALVNLLCGLVILTIVTAANPVIPTTRIAKLAEEHPAQMAQLLRPGDQILRVDGRRVYSVMDIGFFLSRNHTDTAALVVLRDGKREKFPAVPFPKVEGESALRAGFFVQYYSRDRADTKALGRPGLGVVLGRSAGSGLSLTRMVWVGLGDMIGGRMKFRDLSGPIGVVTILSEGAQEVQQSVSNAEATKEDRLYSVLDLLMLFAMISVNIGLMNLLPLPALDGGRLFFTLLEMIFRKPVPKKLEMVVHAAGFAVLMLFMVVISFSDILALIKK